MKALNLLDVTTSTGESVVPLWTLDPALSLLVRIFYLHAGLSSSLPGSRSHLTTPDIKSLTPVLPLALAGSLVPENAILCRSIHQQRREEEILR